MILIRHYASFYIFVIQDGVKDGVKDGCQLEICRKDVSEVDFLVVSFAKPLVQLPSAKQWKTAPYEILLWFPVHYTMFVQKLHYATLASLSVLEKS